MRCQFVFSGSSQSLLEQEDFFHFLWKERYSFNEVLAGPNEAVALDVEATVATKLSNSFWRAVAAWYISFGVAALLPHVTICSLENGDC